MMMDPWVITPQERTRHTEQFNSVHPENGFVTGSQAKGFFMQSNLPPMVLAQIWGLADVNGDGKMDFNEFSIACKLINLKLKGMELPKTLPPQMLAVPPNHLALGGMRPMQPGMHGMGMPGGMMMPGQRMPGMPGMMGHPHQPVAASSMMGGMMPANSMGGMMSMAGGGMVPATSMAGMMGHGGHMMGNPGMMGHPGMMGMQQHHPAIPGVQPSVMPAAVMPAAAAPAAPSPTPAVVEWAIPQQKRAMAMAQFQANDKAKTGFLAAVQARPLLLQTGLAQQTLATVWNLADVDKDGKLSCEEFVLAMHLCDMGLKGEPLPPQLPFNLVPPSMRKNHPGAGVSTPGSVKSGTNEEAMSPASFEDKRRENWEAGQAELQKRRASLLDQQKREEEARKKKEREEAEKREQQKRAAEQKREAELERQRQRQLEIKMQEEEQRRKQEEQRELARKEMERQRLEEWEKSRKAELENHRRRETEAVISLRAKRENLNTELEALRAKMTGLSDGIIETRTGVTDVKTFIDGMRSSRDTKMAELNAVKNKLKEQNQRLLQVTQEKSRLESKNKVNQIKLEGGKEVEITDFDLKREEKKEKVVQLRTLAQTIKDEEENRRQEVENNKKALMDHRDKLKKMIEACKALHEGFDEKRREVRAEKQKKIRELTDPNHAWDVSVEEPEENAAEVAAEPLEAVTSESPPPAIVGATTAAAAGDTAQTSVADADEYHQYRALYDYEARNADELSFAVDDIILVHPGQDHEPGWLGGELGGKVGWFPEAYAQRVGGGEGAALQPIAEVPENGSDSGSYQSQVHPLDEAALAADAALAAEAAAAAGTDTSAVNAQVSFERQDTVTEANVNNTAGGEAEYEQYISVYPYQSGEPGDLVFEEGELILVSAKDGDWWTGSCRGQTGVFPFNYVQPAPKEGEDSGDNQTALQESGDTETNNNLDNTTTEGDKSGKKMEIATVIAPYTASSKEQLTLAQGQMVLVRKKTETGWWQGELQAGGKGKKRAVGWFPASYVKLLDGGVGGGAAPAAEAEVGGAKQPAATGGEKYVALFDYVAQYEDELSFTAGETVTVTAKDEAEWWRGEAGGRQGVFPSNYVEAAKLEVTVSGASKRQNLINEIFSTESTYLDNIKLVFEVFLKPIRKREFLSKEELEILFINWKDLILANTKLFKSLKIRRSSSTSEVLIGDILCENFPAMTAYIRFCSSQFTAAALLQKLVETKPEFDAFIRECQSHPKVQGMPLSFYLLKPVKRVTEYPVLVEKLLKNTPTDHPDYYNTREALEKAKTLCEQVNEGMREKENSERLEWLQIHVDLHTEEKIHQEKITFNSMTNSVGPRRFLHCGVLHKTKSDKELIGFLFNDFLLLTTPSKQIGDTQFSFDKHFQLNLRVYRQPLFLNSLEVGPSIRKTISSEQDPDTGFSLKYKDLTVGLDGLSTNDRTLWLNKLSRAIKDYEASETEFLSKQEKAKDCEMKEARGRLLLIILKGERLSNQNSGGNIDPYCEATIGSQEQKSPVVTGTNPHWNTSMQFFIRDVDQDILCLTVYDRDLFSPNEFLGRAELRVKDVARDCKEKMGPVTRTLKLLEADSGVLSVKLDIQLFA